MNKYNIVAIDPNVLGIESYGICDVDYKEFNKLLHPFETDIEINLKDTIKYTHINKDGTSLIHLLPIIAICDKSYIQCDYSLLLVLIFPVASGKIIDIKYTQMSDETLVAPINKAKRYPAKKSIPGLLRGVSCNILYSDEDIIR